MTGFKEFLMRGNLVELAVAVVMGTTFAAVVRAFTDLLLDIIGRFGGVPNFSAAVVAGISFGAFLSALFTFVLTGLVIYFFVVLPYNKLATITKKNAPDVAASTVDLLAEIRDLLKEQRSA